MVKPFDELMQRAAQARRERRHEDARRDLVQTVAFARGASEPGELAAALTALGQIERDLHHLEEARRLYEEAVSLYRGAGDASRLAHTVRHLGDILRHLHDKVAGESCYEEALAIYRAGEKTSPLELANTLRGYALLKEDTGDLVQARRMWEEARVLYREAKVEAGVAESDRRLAGI